jgi:hypothetical protein
MLTIVILIRPPKPNRFGRAMKQMYRTSYVLGHYVHYSTVTTDVAQTYEEFMQMPHSDPNDYIPFIHGEKWEQRTPAIFVDELTQGALVHVRTILPYETRRRSAECYRGSRFACQVVGHLCEDSVEFVDALLKSNSFSNFGWKLL